MKDRLKWPLVVAAIFVVGRVALERSGAPLAITNMVSVSVLVTLIFPLYFAWRISRSGEQHSYKELIKSVLLFAVLARLMVVPTYWLAYVYQWADPRFSESASGVVGPDITAIQAYVLVPLGLTLSWVIGAMIIGGGLGSILIAVRRRKVRAAA